MASEFTQTKVLIWGKTTPELSKAHLETVCTGGVLEDGTLVRLYPVPFVLLKEDQQFKKYQWIQVRMRKNHKKDSRPESRIIDPESIKIVTEDSYKSDAAGITLRAKYLFRQEHYQFTDAESLYSAQKRHGQSLGIVRVKEIERVYLLERSQEDQELFEKKRAELVALKQQGSLFENSADLSFLENRDMRRYTIKVAWRCHGPSCGGHDMMMLDWEATATIQRLGKHGAQERIESIFKNAQPHLRFMLGNLKMHPSSFIIGGYWLWEIADQGTLELD